MKSLKPIAAATITATTMYQYDETNVDVPISTRVAHGRLSPSAAKIGSNFGSTNIVMIVTAMPIAATTVAG